MFTSLTEDKAVSDITYAETSPGVFTATATTTTAHGYGASQWVLISGADQPEYNGTFQVTVTSATTFTYTLPSNPGTNATGSIVASVYNQVLREFNGFGQLTTEYQQHVGGVTTSSPKVQYAYDASNGSRLTSMTYPNGRVLRYDYGATSDVDYKIGRVQSLKEDGTTQALEQYSYLGLGTIVERKHGQPDVDLTYFDSTVLSGDPYTGLDGFGRVKDQRWVKTGTSTDVDRFEYTYDRNSNRLTRDWTATGAPTDADEAYTYDGLNRLAKMDRGELSGGTIATPTHTRDWTSDTGTGLDALGNWRSVTTDGTPQSRTHDSQNRLTGVGSSTLTYDNNGNMTTDENGRTRVYNAWNQLVQAAGQTTDVYMSYDALGRRNVAFPLGYGASYYYYSAGWQMIEERNDTLSTPDGIYAQNVWSLAYVDALVLRDREVATAGDLGKSGSGLDERLYAVQDANFNVTAVVDTSGAIVERYQYDPYGSFTVLDANFVADANSISDVDWKHLHQGGAYEVETGLHYFRHRDYSATLGRWVQQDLLGYVDGSNLYMAFGHAPATLVDPLGLTVDAGEEPHDDYNIDTPLNDWLDWIEAEFLRPLADGAHGWGYTDYPSHWTLTPGEPYRDNCGWCVDYTYAPKPGKTFSKFWEFNPEDELAKNRPEVRHLINEFNATIREHERQHRQNITTLYQPFTVTGCGVTPEGARQNAAELGYERIKNIELQAERNRNKISNPEIRNRERELLRRLFEAFRGPQVWPNGNRPR